MADDSDTGVAVPATFAAGVSNSLAGGVSAGVREFHLALFSLAVCSTDFFLFPTSAACGEHCAICCGGCCGQLLPPAAVSSYLFPVLDPC